MDITDKIDKLLISEGIFKKVIRKGKMVKKLVCQPGFKAVGNKCVKMSATEIRKRSMSSKLAQRKLGTNKAKMAKMAKKRAKSMIKRGIKIPDVFTGGDVNPMKLGNK